MDTDMKRVFWMVSFGLYIAALTFFSLSPDSWTEIAAVLVMLGFGAVMGLALWPRMAAADLRATSVRVAGAVCIGVAFALVMTVVYTLLPEGGARSPAAIGFLIGAVNSCLDWPGIERGIRQMLGR